VSTSTGYADVVFRFSAYSIMKFGSLVLQEPSGTTKKFLIIADQGQNAIYSVDVSSYVSGGATLGTSAVTMILPRTGSCTGYNGCGIQNTEQTTSAAGAAGYAFSVALSKDQNTLYFSSAYTDGTPPDTKGNFIRSVALDGTNYITKTVAGSQSYPGTNSPITSENAAYGTSATEGACTSPRVTLTLFAESSSRFWPAPPISLEMAKRQARIHSSLAAPLQAARL
jgi:hypothetical protein